MLKLFVRNIGYNICNICSKYLVKIFAQESRLQSSLLCGAERLQRARTAANPVSWQIDENLCKIKQYVRNNICVIFFEIKQYLSKKLGLAPSMAWRRSKSCKLMPPSHFFAAKKGNSELSSDFRNSELSSHFRNSESPSHFFAAKKENQNCPPISQPAHFRVKHTFPWKKEV